VKSFDLLTAPWLRCAMADGAVRMLSLRDLVAEAHTIREIAEPSPLDTFAAYRLIFAVVHWLDPVRTVDDWTARRKAGCFPASLVDGLLERGQGRFDLFHPERPFYQHPKYAAGNKPLTVAYLAMQMPVGTNINHFSHCTDDGHVFCPACCAKGLLALAPFATQGGAGKPMSINGPPPLYAVPRGTDVFGTVLLNVPILDRADRWAKRKDEDCPAWERDGPPIPPGDPRPVGYVEGLTWQPRRAHLIPVEGAVRCTCCGCDTPLHVKEMRYPPGGDSRGEKATARAWVDPHVSMADADGSTLRPSDMPEAWCRGAKALLPEAARDYPQPCPVVGQTHLLVQEGRLPQEHGIVVDQVALHAQKATCHRWFSGSLPLLTVPPATDGTVTALRAQLDHISEVHISLARKLAPADASRDAKIRARDEARGLLRTLHASAQAAFRQACTRIASIPDDAEGCVRDFRDTVDAALEDAFQKKRELRPVQRRWHPRKGIPGSQATPGKGGRE